MRILYIDIRSLLYSNQYLNSREEVKQARMSVMTNVGPNVYLERVKPDRHAANLLEQAAQVAGLTLFPIGDFYSRDALIQNRLFSEVNLAPDVPEMFVRPDDRDELRMLLRHCHAVGAEFFIIGDMLKDGRLDPYNDRYIRATVETGLTEEMLEIIRHF